MAERIKSHQHLLPKRRTVEMNHHPLRRVKDEGVCKLNSVDEVAQLRTKKSRTCVRRVHMQPETFTHA